MDAVNAFLHTHLATPAPKAVVQLMLSLVEAKVQLAELEMMHAAMTWGLRWRGIPRFGVFYMEETGHFAFFDRMLEIESLIFLDTNDALAMLLGVRADPTALIRKYGHNQRDEGGCMRWCAGWMVWLFEL